MNPPPSWFSTQGPPSAGRNSEFEGLAWCYVTTQARTGDRWQDVTPEELLLMLDSTECVLSRHRINEAIRGVGMGSLWFNEIALILKDPEGASSVGGHWNRDAWNLHLAR